MGKLLIYSAAPEPGVAARRDDAARVYALARGGRALPSHRRAVAHTPPFDAGDHNVI